MSSSTFEHSSSLLHQQSGFQILYDLTFQQAAICMLNKAAQGLANSKDTTVFSFYQGRILYVSSTQCRYGSAVHRHWCPTMQCREEHLISGKEPVCISTILDPQWVAAEVLGGISKEVVQGQDPNRHHNLQAQS